MKAECIKCGAPIERHDWFMGHGVPTEVRWLHVNGHGTCDRFTAKEPDNEDRAGWALVALNAYGKETRAVDQILIEDGAIGGRDLLEEVAGDLICDLMHLLAKHGLEPEEIMATGRYHYGEES